jgi:nucleoid-associated protein YgaU
MKKMMLVTALAGLAVAGCAKKTAVKPEPTPAPAVTAVPEVKATKTKSTTKNYVVKPGDSLWKISARKGTLGDAFRWPLIFKANRDQIQDPDLIEPKQDLSFKKSYSKDEIAEAVKKAEMTPPFEPHKQPRKVLPIQY